MKAAEPFVSVVMPVYNGRPFLLQALESVRRQAYCAVEIIVIDDGSTDGSGDVASAFGVPVTCIRQQNRGAAAARNHGLGLARGSYIALLDADDLWPDGTLKMLVSYLETHGEADVAVGRVQYIRRATSADGRASFEPYAEPCLALNLGAALYRRDVFEKVGKFDENLRISDDVDWFMRAREKGLTLAFLSNVTLLYRRHDANMTLERNAAHAELAVALKKSLDRRRQAGKAQSLKPLTKSADRER